MDTNSVTAIVQHIDALANKLGGTAQFIFELYVRQATVSGVTCTILMLSFLIISIFLVKRVWILPQENVSDDHEFVLWIATVIAVAITVLMFLLATETVVTSLVNPEYWAIHKILCDIK